MNRYRSLTILLLALASPAGLASVDVGHVLTPSEVHQLRTNAERELAAVAARIDDAAAPKRHGLPPASVTLQRADAEPDPQLREALLERWLRDWAPERRSGPAIEASTLDRVEALTRFEPIVRVGHHEHPGRFVPAFNVAGQARNRLHRIAVRDRADELLRRPETPDILEPLLRGPKSARLPEAATPLAFEAAVTALAELSGERRRPLVAALRSQLTADRTGTGNSAGPALLELHERGALSDDSVLLDLVRHAETSVAAAALRRTDRAGDPVLKSEAVRTALARPGLGGLAMARAAASPDPDLAAAPWSLLDDPGLGGDAALALARNAPALESGVEARYPNATKRERLRMQLALQLRDTRASRSLLARLTATAASPNDSLPPASAQEIER